jgi:hypothetical protein
MTSAKHKALIGSRGLVAFLWLNSRSSCELYVLSYIARNSGIAPINAITHIRISHKLLIRTEWRLTPSASNASLREIPC